MVPLQNAHDIVGDAATGDPLDEPADVAFGQRLELIRPGGHRILREGGLHHAEIEFAVRTGVPAPDE